MRILTETVSHNGNEVTSGVSVTGREVTMVGEAMEHVCVDQGSYSTTNPNQCHLILNCYCYTVDGYLFWLIHQRPPKVPPPQKYGLNKAWLRETNAQ